MPNLAVEHLVRIILEDSAENIKISASLGNRSAIIAIYLLKAVIKYNGSTPIKIDMLVRPHRYAEDGSCIHEEEFVEMENRVSVIDELSKRLHPFEIKIIEHNNCVLITANW